MRVGGFEFKEEFGLEFFHRLRTWIHCSPLERVASLLAESKIQASPAEINILHA